MIWLNFLISYLVMSFACGFAYTVWCLSRDEEWGALLIPSLTEFLDVKGAKAWVRRLVYIVFTIMFLPYLIVYYILLFILIMIVAIATEMARRRG